ncbi:MAG TPA: hypothetical protein VFB66_19045 [Tepidisphaeraceae bacterium]|nr:hypothetical protein [Tepidisphaeraceae bacterium]
MDQATEDERVLAYNRPVAPPWWVLIGLWGVPGRTAAMIYLWSTLAIAVACLGLGFVFPFAWAGTLFVLATLWYWAAIRWKDRHAYWSR